LAGLPPEYGLYCAMVPAIVAALFGSSLHTVAGPTNPVSLMVLASLAPLATPGTRHYIELALTLALMSGVMLVAMSVLGLGALPKIPPMLVAMLAGSLLAFALNQVLGAERTGLRTLGPLAGALPPLSIPDLSAGTLQSLLGAAIAVALVSLTQAVSIAHAIALKSGQRIDNNQEFIGQGLANVAAAFFSGFPTSTSANRCGINYESGAKTPMSAVFAAVLLVLVLLAIAPLAAYL